MKKRWLPLLTTLGVLLISTVVVDVSPASAAAKCRASGCHGKMASAMGCVEDAFVISGRTLVEPDASTPPELDLYYSKACHAAWGEFNSTYSDEHRHVALYVQEPFGGPYDSIFYIISNPGNTTTTMASWDYSIKLCAHFGLDPDINGNVVNFGEMGCTKWR